MNYRMTYELNSLSTSGAHGFGGWKPPKIEKTLSHRKTQTTNRPHNSVKIVQTILTIARSRGIPPMPLKPLSLLVCIAGFFAGAHAQQPTTNFTDIVLADTDDHELRFMTGRVVYVEALREGRWVSRFWNASARINWPFELWEEPAFHLEVDGKSADKGWTWVTARELKKTDRGARHHVVELRNTERSLHLEIHTVLDGTPIIQRWLKIKNESDGAVGLTGISPWSGRAWANPGVKDPIKDLDAVFRLGYFAREDWAAEGWFRWEKVNPGNKKRIESRKGYGYNEPFFVIQNPLTGEHVIGHLGWCSNYFMNFECATADPDRHPWGDVLAASHYVNYQIGPIAKDALRVLAPGESTESPPMHLGRVAGDLDAAVQAMHDHTRRFVMPAHQKDRAYLIQYLAPGDQGYMDKHSEMSGGPIFSNIDMAAELGAELFILDCGWFVARGDFYPDPKRFPDGLNPIIEYCRKKGMLFGIWTEFERCHREGTRLSKTHPDWILDHDNLDMTNPEVVAYVESEIHRQVKDYKLDLIRLAYDTYFPFEGKIKERFGIRESSYWRHYESFHDIFKRTHERYPHIVLQNCSAGIGRAGMRMAGRFHEFYMTDGLWLPQVTQVYAGRSLAYPPEIFVIAHGAVREQALGRPANLDTFLRCQFTLAIPQLFSGMIGPSLKSLHPERRERFKHYAKLYKSFIRPLWPTAKVFHHEPINLTGDVESSPWFAMEFAAPDRSRGWATIVRIGESATPLYIFRPRGVDVGKTYRVTFDSTGSTIEIKGWELKRDGLPIPLETRIASELLLFEAI